jgi:hypothetical protein
VDHHRRQRTQYTRVVSPASVRNRAEAGDEGVVLNPVEPCGNAQAIISEWIVWARSCGTRQLSVTREAVRLTTIIRTLDGDKAKKVLCLSPKVGVLEGIEGSAKWFVEEAKNAEEFFFLNVLCFLNKGEREMEQKKYRR